LLNKYVILNYLNKILFIRFLIAIRPNSCTADSNIVDATSGKNAILYAIKSEKRRSAKNL